MQSDPLHHRVLRRTKQVSLPFAAAALLLAVGSGGGIPTSQASNLPQSAPTVTTAQPQRSGDFGTEYQRTGIGPMVAPTIPITPSVPTAFGELQCTTSQAPDLQAPAPGDCTRVFHLTAKQFTQQIANFPLQTAQVWGYQAPGTDPSTPGPTLVSYEGEQVQIVETNELSEPTTIHPHGLHQPNDADGVAVVSQPNPIQPGQTYHYPSFTPGHIGTFAYHSHFDSAVQEMRGLDGMWIVLPRSEHQSIHADVDVVMTLQIWDWDKNGELVHPFGDKSSAQFPFDTINGKTGDAAGGPITIHTGDLVRIRFYNASQQTHAMHLHGHDEVVVAKNGHAEPGSRETTQTITPGDFFDIEFRADNPGNWVFHCHFPHHTANGMNSGFNGAPVGMTRIFHYEGADPIAPEYFSDKHFKSETIGS